MIDFSNVPDDVQKSRACYFDQIVSPSERGLLVRNPGKWAAIRHDGGFTDREVNRLRTYATTHSFQLRVRQIKGRERWQVWVMYDPRMVEESARRMTAARDRVRRVRARKRSAA